MIDFLRIVSDVFKRTLPEGMKVRYCCINGFHPLIKKRPTDDAEESTEKMKRYRVFSETLVVEEGLEEWYDVSWTTDETDILAEVRQETIVQTTVLPLKPETPCHERPLPPSLFDLLEHLMV
jgi:hypothetical protein